MSTPRSVRNRKLKPVLVERIALPPGFATTTCQDVVSVSGACGGRLRAARNRRHFAKTGLDSGTTRREVSHGPEPTPFETRGGAAGGGTADGRPVRYRDGRAR